MYRIRRKKSLKRPIVSTTEAEADTEAGAEEEERPSLAVASETAGAPDRTEFTQAPPAVTPITSQETTGRTWADVVSRYSSNQRYLYLLVLLVPGVLFAITGNLKTFADGAALGCLVLTTWFVLWLIQRK